MKLYLRKMALISKTDATVAIFFSTELFGKEAGMKATIGGF